MNKNLSGGATKISAFFKRHSLLALAAILLVGVSAAASLLLPMAHAGFGAENGGEAMDGQIDKLKSINKISSDAVPTIKNQEQSIWNNVERRFLRTPDDNLPAEFETFQLDRQALNALLNTAPHERNVPLGKSQIALKLPYPDGTLRTFRIQEAPVLEPSLAARFPEIKSYRALSVDDPGTTARFDLTPRGFHATILAPDKTVSILPADKNDETLYASYEGASQTMNESGNFSCSIGAEQPGETMNGDAVAAVSPTPTPTPVTAVPINRKLKTYRIAISASYEYFSDANLGNNSMTNTVASINTWMNAINAIYERELSIRLLVVIYKPNTDSHAIQTQINDPYDDFNYSTFPGDYSDRMLNAVRKELHTKIGSDNYNLGHVFTRFSPGGVAGLGNVCDTSSRNNDGLGQRKGEGYSGLVAPAGNLESLKVLAHEIGHQFGANHSFNGVDCGGSAPNYPNRSATSSYEVGSGNTIMSYHGVCGTDNVVGTRSESLRFHSHSFTQITDHVYNGIGKNCGSLEEISNSPPTIDLPETYTIPKFTPFALTATGGSDPDLGDVNNLIYTWEQYQPGGTQFYQNFGSEATYNDLMDLNSATPTTRPIFRPTQPTISPSRTFPSLKYILNDKNDPPHKEGNLITAEELPRIGRTLEFRVTVRDTLGGVAYKPMTVKVAPNAGTFKVSEPNTAVNWTGGTTQIVKWDVAGTNGNGINTTSVKILLSTDGGQTFPTVLSYGAPNVPDAQGIASASVNVPNNISTTTARIKIQPTENIFFDISDTNFTITPPVSACPIVNDISPKGGSAGTQVVITGSNFTDASSVVFGGNVAATNFIVNSNTKITVTVPAGAQGGEIRVRKNSCAEALSSRFAFCSGTADPVNSIDDGSLETNGYAASGTNYRVNRLTPTSYPATLSEVRIYHNDAFPTTKKIRIVSATNPSGSENISNLTFNTREGEEITVGTQNQFVTYRVDPITIYSGDFVVGYSFDRAADESEFPVAVDQRTASNPYPNPLDPAHFKKRSYFSADGINFYTEPDKNYMIRANAFYGTSTLISVSDETKEFNGSAFQGKSYHVNRLTPASYPATLNKVSIYHRSDVGGFPTTKQITILSAANPTGNATVNNTKFNQKAATVSAVGNYVTYPIDPITIHSGDFIVGYSFDRAANEATHPVALDTTSPDARRSYYSSDGVNFRLTLPTENFMIRAAILSASPCSNGDCTYSTALTSGSIPGAGGTGTLSVITQTGCPWKASRTVPWIRLLSLGNLSEEMIAGTGSGTINFAVDQNTGTERSGGITVFGRIISVPQNFQRLQPDGEDPEPEIFEAQVVTFEQQAGLQPTAAAVSVGGRVTARGRAMPWTIVSLTNAAGETRTELTNAFGYYRFEEVPVGENYVVTVSLKRYNFAPRVINVNEEIENLNFAAE